LPVVSKDNLSEIRDRVAAMEAERDALEVKQRRLRVQFMPHDEDRLGFLRNTIKSLQSHISAIERLAA
jgi:hypothetical protein